MGGTRGDDLREPPCTAMSPALTGTGVTQTSAHPVVISSCGKLRDSSGGDSSCICSGVLQEDCDTSWSWLLPQVITAAQCEPNRNWEQWESISSVVFLLRPAMPLCSSWHGCCSNGIEQLSGTHPAPGSHPSSGSYLRLSAEATTCGSSSSHPPRSSSPLVTQPFHSTHCD